MTASCVDRIRRIYKLKTHRDRLRETGLLTKDEIAKSLGISVRTVAKWRKHGLLRGRVYNALNEYLYEPVGENQPVKKSGQKLSRRRRFNEVANDSDKEVQCEA